MIALALALATLLAAPARSDPSRTIRAADPDPFFLVMQALAFDEGKVLVVSPEGIVTDVDLFGDVFGQRRRRQRHHERRLRACPGRRASCSDRLACDKPGRLLPVDR